MLGKIGVDLGGVGSLVTAGALGVPFGGLVLIAGTLVLVRVLTMDPRLVDAFGRLLRNYS